MAIALPTPEDIRRLRKRAGLTQAELARRAGVSQSLIARIERGTVDPRLSTLMRILRALEEYISEELTAKEVMTSPVITAKTTTPLEELVKIMWERGISQVPVLSEDGEILGTVFERDVVDAFLKYREKALEKCAGDIMSDPLPIVAPSTKLSAIAGMLSKDTPAVLVVSRGKLVGIITRSDLMKIYVEWFKGAKEAKS